MVRKNKMNLDFRPSAYLAGPMDQYDRGKARAWRNALKPRLAEIGITWFDPMDAKGNREQTRRWNEEGAIEKIREHMATKVNRPDLHNVLASDLVIVNIPRLAPMEEICGTYGEITMAFYNFIPVFVLTDRSLEPNKLPRWAIGCSTAIFDSVDDLLMYLEDEYHGKKQ